VFGNIAVAFGACQMLENGTTGTRDVSAFLFVKDQGAWGIAGQVWDLASDAKPVPLALQQSV
jgi:hypothetical protein